MRKISNAFILPLLIVLVASPVHLQASYTTVNLSSSSSVLRWHFLKGNLVGVAESSVQIVHLDDGNRVTVKHLDGYSAGAGSYLSDQWILVCSQISDDGTCKVYSYPELKFKKNTIDNIQSSRSITNSVGAVSYGSDNAFAFFSSYSKKYSIKNAISLLNDSSFTYFGGRGKGYPDPLQIELKEASLSHESQTQVIHVSQDDNLITAFFVENMSRTNIFGTHLMQFCTGLIWTLQMYQTWLSCGQGYNIVNDVHVMSAYGPLATKLNIKDGSRVYIATFGKYIDLELNEDAENTGGAICVFSNEQIRSQMKKEVDTCIKKKNNMCRSFFTSIDKCSIVKPTKTCYSGFHLCTDNVLEGHVLYESDIDTLKSTTVYDRHYYDSKEKENVFIWTTTGSNKIIKLGMNRMGEVIKYDEEITEIDNKFIHGAAFSYNDSIAIATDKQIVILDKYVCDTHVDCGSCERDPNCGWCILNNKCSLYEKCSHDNRRDRFLTSYCLSANISHSDIDIINDNVVYVNVNNLPVLLAGESYLCIIGGKETESSVVKKMTIACDLPSVNSRGKITGHSRTVSLTIRHSKYHIDFLRSEITYYDCNLYKTCGDCSKVKFTCSWCPNDNSCIGDSVVNTKCSKTDIVYNTNDCPRIIENKDIFIPNNYEISNFRIKTAKLIPSIEYECVFLLSNKEIRIKASIIEQDFVECKTFKLEYKNKKPNIEVKVQLQYDRNFTIDSFLIVNLYKCSEMANDCSKCLSIQNDFSNKYNCSWCKDSCVYSKTCSTSISVCPKPIIQSIIPTSGVIDGGQVLEINGLNLGIQFSDVKEAVFVGKKKCIPIEKDYHISKSIKCIVPPSLTSKSVDVVIDLDNHTPVISSKKYTYRNPKLLSMQPDIGPISGGTTLYVSGEQLLTGKRVQIFFGKSYVCNYDNFSINDSYVECITSKVSKPENKVLYAEFDNILRNFSSFPFKFVSDPNVTQISPLLTTNSGGKILTINGNNFNCIQNPKIFFIYNNKTSTEQKCQKISDKIMNCLAPELSSLIDNSTSSRKRRSVGSQVNVGFKMDAVYKLTDLQKYYPELDLTLTTYPDPIFKHFLEDPYIFNGDTLVIDGENLNLGISKNDIKVLLGDSNCEIKSLTNTQLFCSVEINDDLFESDVRVIISVGAWLKYDIGILRFPGATKLNRFLIIGIIVGVVALIAIFIIILIFYARKSSAASRQFKKIQIQLDCLESNVRNECKQAFAELQTEVSDFQDDVHHKGIPFRDFKTYTFKILFPTHADHPIFHKNETSYADCELNLMKFAQLLNSKNFLLIFIKTLEKQKAFQIRDKSLIASLLTVVFHDKMDYATEILTNLLSDLIDHSIETKNPKLMLRRHESVVEKFLTNWMSLCMYDYLKNDAGRTLYVLYKSIKYQSEKGPVDAITGVAKYSLSDNTLLRENINYEQLTVLVNYEMNLKPVPCRVLDCDTITQTKCKILDCIFRDKAYSVRPAVHQMELHWMTGSRGAYIVLEDDDVSTISSSPTVKRLNTLQHYRIPSNATFSLVKNLNSMDDIHKVNGRFEIMSGLVLNAVVEDGMDCWHLVKKDTCINRSQKVISEIFLTRLLSTKGTLQQFIDDLFYRILESGDSIPPAIKFLFDFFDESAKKHNITDPEVVHAWKSNSLPLRFWVNILKNPDFIFDVNKTSIIDSCLSVVASSFMDSCSLTEHRLGKDSPSNKLLFARDIPRYKTLIRKYFEKIKEMPKISNESILSKMRQHSQVNRMDLNVNAALKELLTFARQYSFEILVNLEDDCSAKKLRLATKFDEVLGNTETFNF